MNRDERRAANEDAVRGFFAGWDPAWRWILLLGLRQLRDDPVALGRLASAEADDQESWSEETYVYGPLTRGLTAAAVNEVAQYCEDLFALLRFLREPEYFARRMGSYAAGKVVEFGRGLATADDAAVSRLLLVPDADTVRAGLDGAPDVPGATAVIETGRARLGAMVRETAAFYREFEDFHNQYKHGLKLPLRGFGTIPPETVAERRGDRRAPLFAYTNEPIAAMLRRSQPQQMMMFNAGERQRPHLAELVAERNLLRLQLAHEVDLDEVVDRAHVIMQLLQIAQVNRLALGRVDDDEQGFDLPGERRWERIHVTVRLDRPLALEDFAEPSRPGRA